MTLTLGARTTFIDNYQFPSYLAIAGINQNHFIVIYNRASAVRMVCGSVSGLVPTMGSEALFRNNGRTTTGIDIARLNDDYAAGICYRSSTTFTVKIIERSGTALSVGVDQGNLTGLFRGICALDDSTIVTAGTNGTSIAYVTAGAVNKAAKTVSFGSTASISGSENKSMAKIDNFNSTYGVIALNASDQKNEQLLLFSVSGTTVTLGSFIDLTLESGFTNQRAIDVVCLGEDRLAALIYSYDGSKWTIRVKYFSRSGLTLTEIDDYGVYDSNALPFTPEAKIFAEKDNSYVYVIFENNSEPKILLESFKVSSSALTKDENNLEIEDLTGSSGNQYPAGDCFPGVNSLVLGYVYNLTNHIGAVRIGEPTGGGFIPQLMLV